MTGYVYAIICPYLKEIVYVGSTVHSVEFRVRQHITSRQSSGILYYLWALNEEPLYITLEVVSYRKIEKLREKERFWTLLISKTKPLLNKHNNHKPTDSSAQYKNIIDRLKVAKKEKRLGKKVKINESNLLANYN